MKKILIVTPYCPYPPHKSGGIHALYNILKINENKKMKIDLFYYDKRDIEAEKEISKYVIKIIHKDLRKEGKSVRVKSIINMEPYGIYQYKNISIKNEGKYDVIIFDQELSIGLVDSFESKEKILMAYDSMDLYFKRKAEVNRKNIIEYIYNISQSFFYKKLHKVNFSKFNKIYYVSSLDLEYEKNLNPNLKNKMDTINLGVNYLKFNSKIYKKCENKNLIFTGIMSYGPNKDAAIYFAKNIMPKIKSIDPTINFIIVGKNPSKEILELENENVKVAGYVENIVEAICNCRIYVSPLRYGTGMKNKILEAMSCEKPIVASETSIEGILELENNRNIFIPKNDEEWVKYIIEFVRNESKSNEFGKICREIIINNYSWEKAYIKLFL